MYHNKKALRLLAFLIIVALMLGACAPSATTSTDSASETTVSDMQASSETQNSEDMDSAEATSNTDTDAPQISGLTYVSTMELSYAECFAVYYYEDGYSLIEVYDSATYLVVPQDMPVPDGLDESIIVLQQPLDTIYLVATAAMALFDAIDALDTIRLSGTQASGWYIDNAVAAMEAGDILFAGKYSEPDYELLVSEDCDLAIESSMILHAPNVQEMIEALEIPVFIDRSSYETHPLGRTEWIKLYGVLVDREDEALAFFESQMTMIEELSSYPATEQTVVFFYINTDGMAVVRNPDDYIVKMIEMAGGDYLFSYLEDDSDSTSTSISIEEFYAIAIDADYLIYNNAIDTTVSSIDDLLSKNELFEDFKAVQNGNVLATGKALYQATASFGQFITDIRMMLTDDKSSDMTFLFNLE